MRKPEGRQAGIGLFIGACGSAVAATTPEVRFEGRISEKSAERSARRPLTLMNSARRGSTGRGPVRAQRKRRQAAGVRKGEEALGFAVGEGPDCAAGATPQDPAVSIAIRRVLLTMKRLLWLSEFNAVIDVRCLNQRIEQLNMSPLFTLNQFRSQEFSRFSRACCSISSTHPQRRAPNSFLRTHEEDGADAVIPN